VTRILAVYPAAVAALLLALPALAPRSGPLTLVNIFSVHVALAALLLVPVALRGRDSVLRVSLAALAVVAVVRFGGEWVSAPPSAATPDRLLETASWNLELGAREGPAAAAAIATIDVDLIALQELGPDHARAIEASETVTTMYPHRVLYPEAGVFGMGLLSRHLIARAEYRQDPSLIEAVIEVDGQELTVLDVHPLAGRIDMAGPIPIGFDSNKRDGSLRRIRERIEKLIGRGQSVIVLGDLNATPFEPGYLELAHGLNDAHAEVGQGPGWTWRPDRLEWAAMGVIRIDHALSSPRITPVAVAEHCDRPGDHCILEASFSIAGADGRFDVVFPAIGDLPALPVTIVDRTGRVVSAETTATGPGGGVVERDPARPNALVVPWTGGMCDLRADVAVVQIGPEIQVGIHTDRADGVCRLAGIVRTISLGFDGPVDPSIVTVVASP
jgi:endonuclease/exonuclease/phosphatase (EEP) superfamily protein YafD